MRQLLYIYAKMYLINQLVAIIIKTSISEKDNNECIFGIYRPPQWGWLL